jgi:hypothetical protein
VKTVRHFFPQLNAWLTALPDTRFQPFVVYHPKFLWWWGLLLFCCKRGSRRQLDYDLRDLETAVLDNVNRLAGTAQESLPVHKTLDHFLGHSDPSALAGVRARCVRHLMRQRVLGAGRLQGRFVVALDGTGCLAFAQRHCPHCLTKETAAVTVYLHPVLEAKLVDERGLAISIGTEFIENPGRAVMSVFGSLKNLAQRLLECVRYFAIPAEAFDEAVAAHCQVRLDGS